MIIEDKLRLAGYIGTDSDVPIITAGGIKAEVKNQRSNNQVDMDKNWNFYQGNHTEYFEIRDREPNELFKLRKNTATIANYTKLIINVGSRFLYGKPDTVRRNYTAPEKKSSTTEKRLRDIEKTINLQKMMLEIKRKAGIFGEVPLRMIPVDEVSNTQLFTTSKLGFPQPIILDPRNTFVLQNKWNKIIAIVIEDEFKDYTTGNLSKVLELIVADSRWQWIDDKMVVSEKNNYRLDEEFVLMINDTDKKDDIQDILILQIKLDEALTDSAHFFEKHGWPQLVSTLDLSKVITAPGFVWEISTDENGMKVKDQLDFLTWDGKMKEMRDYIKDLESRIYKISSTAAITSGDMETTGQLRTGAAIVSVHGPSLMKAFEKQVIWQENEKRLNYAIAMFDAKIHEETIDTRFPDLDFSVKFPENIIPGEDLVRAEIDSMSLNAHTTTIREIARRKFPIYTEEQIDGYRKEIMEDASDLTDSVRKFITEKPEGEGQPIKSTKSKSQEQQKSNAE